MTLWSLCQVRREKIEGVVGARFHVSLVHSFRARRGRGLRTSTSPRSSLHAHAHRPTHPQAALMVINGLAIINNDRFLEKCEQ